MSPPRRTLLRALALAAALGGLGALGVLAAESPPDSSSLPPDSARAATRGDAALGRKVYVVKCVACHKADGSGGLKLTGNPTPDWRDAKRMAQSQHDDAYLRDCITNGKIKSGMVSWKALLKPADVENLIAYIRTFPAPRPAKR